MTFWLEELLFKSFSNALNVLFKKGLFHVLVLRGLFYLGDPELNPVLIFLVNLSLKIGRGSACGESNTIWHLVNKNTNIADR